eukprot:jgi/Mesvir1/8511/Mv09809-RA.1
MVSLKVDNISYRSTPDELREMFGRYGKVGDVYIPRDWHTKESRGFAFVRFWDSRDAEDARQALDGRDLDGRPLRVEFAKHGRPEGRPGDRGGFRGGRMGGPDRYSDDRYAPGGGGGDSAGGSRGYGGRASPPAPARGRSPHYSPVDVAPRRGRGSRSPDNY